LSAYPEGAWRACTLEARAGSWLQCTRKGSGREMENEPAKNRKRGRNKQKMRAKWGVHFHLEPNNDYNLLTSRWNVPSMQFSTSRAENSY